MLFPKRKDIVFPVSQPTGTGAQTVKFLVKQERRRLEALTFKLRVTTPNLANYTGAAYGGLAGIVKEIRVVINDGPAGGGQRNVVQVSGIGLLGFISQLNLNLDRQTQACYNSGGGASLAQNTTYEISYYVPLRHPSFQEPLGNVFSLPLSSAFLANDVWVEVDLYDISAGNAVFTANPATYYATNTALLQTHLVEIPDSFPYLRTEFRTDQGFSPVSTANIAYEFVSGGFLTGFLIQGLSGDLGTATSNAVTRTTATLGATPLLTATGQFRLEYGREVLMKVDESFMVGLNDLSRTFLYPNDANAIGASGTLNNKVFSGESFFDFLSELPGQDAFSLASTLNLNTDALAGDKFRVVFNDLAASTRRAHITYHKLLSPMGVITDVVAKAAKAGLSA